MSEEECPCCKGSGFGKPHPRRPGLPERCLRCGGSRTISMPQNARNCEECGGCGYTYLPIHSDLTASKYRCNSCGGKGFIKEGGGFFAKLFGNKLAKNLLSLDRNTREQAILQCLQLAKSGNSDGQIALEEAIREKSKKDSIQFYEPGGLGPTLTIIDAVEEICNLAKSNKLMEDISKTQMLISSIIRQNQSENVMNKLKDIGEDQLQNFQLLATHLQCKTIRLGQSR